MLNTNRRSFLDRWGRWTLSLGAGAWMLPTQMLILSRSLVMPARGTPNVWKKSSRSIRSMARPSMTKTPLPWGRSGNAVINPDSMTSAGKSGRITTPDSSHKSIRIRRPSPCGASAAPSPIPPQSIPGLPAVSSTPPAGMLCISSCTTVFPPTPSPR